MHVFSKYKTLLLALFSIILYFLFAYHLERIEFIKLITLWVLLFTCFYFLVKDNKIPFSNLVGFSILFRIIFLFATPNLSQDFYRFIWDGRMIFEGLNPYLSLPETFIQQGILPIANAKELYLGMGELNGSHYTNYPPLNQFCFFIAAIIASKNIFLSTIILRLLIIFADIGIIYFGKKLLKKLEFSKYQIFWYALNPFIIIEMTGNLHFEPVMLFFFIWGLYQLYSRRLFLAAFLIACSISIKLIPLLFLPLFFKWFVKTNKNWLKSFKNLILFYFYILGFSILFFLPFYSSELIDNYTNSVGLWFRNFEFNASLYYIFREIGYLFRGYNEIALIGKITPILTIIFLLYLSLIKEKKQFITLFKHMLFAICFYYFLSSTVHPWYIATPLILCIFTKYRFPIIWSFVVILSYQAYANNPWKENLWFVAIEYILVFSILFFEVKKVKTIEN